MTGISRRSRVAGELLQHLVAVHLRHLDVEQDQVKGLGCAAVSSACAAVLGHRHGVPCCSSPRASSRRYDLIVIHDQQPARAREPVYKPLRSSSRAPNLRYTRLQTRPILLRRHPGCRSWPSSPARGWRSQRDGTEAGAVGLERMRSPAQSVWLSPISSAVRICRISSGESVEIGINQVGQKVGSGHRFQGVPTFLVDQGFSHSIPSFCDYLLLN